MKIPIIFILLLLIPTLLLARQKTKLTHPEVDIPFEPWFTGTLLAPTPVNMEPGHPAIEPSLTIFNTYGSYDSHWKCKKEDPIWTINPLVDFQFGMTKNMGIEIIASFATNFSKGKSSTHLLDTILLLGYQALHDQKNSWVPDLRILFQTIFPSGKHDRLDPTKATIDFSGQGAYFFGPNISGQKLFYLEKNFFLLHFSFGYFFPSRARIRDVSIYGGVEGTKGSIRPGQSLAAFFSGEYSINQRWVLGYDTFFLYQTKTSRFRGNRATSQKIGLPSSSQISFAPTVEYNFSPNSGLLFGAWFTIAGRNADAFASGFLAYLYVF